LWKYKTMIDLVLNKRRTQNDDQISEVSSTEKEQLSVVKPLLFFIFFGIFLVLSIQSDYLFFSELLVSGGVLLIILFIKLLSKSS
jgi:hypothetical protein